MRYGAGRRDHRCAGRAGPVPEQPLHSRVSPDLLPPVPAACPRLAPGHRWPRRQRSRVPDHPLGNAHISYPGGVPRAVPVEAVLHLGARLSVLGMGVRVSSSVGSARISRPPSSSGRGSTRWQVRRVRGLSGLAGPHACCSGSSRVATRPAFTASPASRSYSDFYRAALPSWKSSSAATSPVKPPMSSSSTPTAGSRTFARKQTTSSMECNGSRFNCPGRKARHNQGEKGREGE